MTLLAGIRVPFLSELHLMSLTSQSLLGSFFIRSVENGRGYNAKILQILSIYVISGLIRRQMLAASN